LGDHSGKSGSEVISGLLNKAAESVITPLLLAFLATIGVAQSQKLEDPSNWRVWIIVLGTFLLVAVAGDAL